MSAIVLKIARALLIVLVLPLAAGTPGCEQRVVRVKNPYITGHAQDPDAELPRRTEAIKHAPQPGLFAQLGALLNGVGRALFGAGSVEARSDVPRKDPHGVLPSNSGGASGGLGPYRETRGGGQSR